MAVEINDIFASVLRMQYEDGEYDVVNSNTSLDGMENQNEQEIESLKPYLVEKLIIDGYDISKLVDTFIEINRTSSRLSVKSDPANGFIVDYDGKFSRYLDKNGEGWEKWHEENPKAQRWITISLPAFDHDSKIVLIYIEKNFYDELFGADGIAEVDALRYEDGELTLLDSVIIWMS